MHVMFIHQNFPAQFRYIAPRLVSDFGWRCTFVTAKETDESLVGIEKIIYKSRGHASTANHICTRAFETQVGDAHGVYETLKSHPQVQPDLIIAHSGFGSSLFLPYLYDAPIINFFEYFYNALGGDLGYRPEIAVTEVQLLRNKTRNAMMLLDLANCERGWTPTAYQREFFPPEFRKKIEVIFDGIDTNVYHRKPNEARHVGKDIHIAADKKIVTYVARGFEMMRGYDIFMKAAKLIYQQNPDVIFVVVGTDNIHYGSDQTYIKEKSFRHHVLKEDNYDLSRFIFTGYVTPETLADILSISDAHIYLTMPFIASWSLVNAMACGAVVVASDQNCVREYINPGENGLLCEFFDHEGLAKQALQVLANPDRFRPLSEAATRTVQEKYSLNVALPRLKKFFEETAARKREPTVRLETLVRPGTMGGPSEQDDPDVPSAKTTIQEAGVPTAAPISLPEPPSIAGLAPLPAALSLVDFMSKVGGSIPEWIALTQNYRGPKGEFARIGADHHPVDLSRLLNRVHEWKARFILDLSGGEGGFTFLLTRTATDSATILVAALPGKNFSRERIEFLQAMARAKQRIVCINGEDWADIGAQVNRTLSGQKLDVMFMSGLRPLADVEINFRHYRNRIRKDGLLAWDGINGIGLNPQTNGGDKLWKEIRPLFPMKAEYLSGVSGSSGGIAMIKLT